LSLGTALPWFRLAQGGLVLLVVALLADPPAGAGADGVARLAIGLLCAAPLLALLAASLRPGPRWGVWVAVVLVPYFALSVGAMLVASGNRGWSAAFPTLVALVFVAGNWSARR